MLFADSALLDQIFRVFDANDDDQISFEEYLKCLSVISNKASREDKHLFSFKLYDFDGMMRSRPCPTWYELMND
jgi:Ca2+-binding EF-hand superfamily protein